MTNSSKANYENIVLEGGGGKISTYIGVKRATEEKGLKFKRVAGSSAGAIFAGAYAIGMTSYELEELILKEDLTNFLDDSWGLISDAFRIYSKFGLYKGDYFYEWYGKILKEKTGNADITFKEIQDRYNVELVITGSCLNKMQVHYYHPASNPDMPIRKAVRISMSIPIAFVPVSWKGDLLVDGGLLDNYPIWIFDKESIDSSKSSVVAYDPDIPVNKKTLGIKLVGPDDKRDGIIYHKDKPIKGWRDFASALISAQLAQNERLHIKSGYWEQTVTVDTGDIGTMDFDQNLDEKEFLIRQGYEATMKFLDE